MDIPSSAVLRWCPPLTRVRKHSFDSALLLNHPVSLSARFLLARLLLCRPWTLKRSHGNAEGYTEPESVFEPKATHTRLQSGIDFVIFKTIPYRGGRSTVILKQRFSVGIASPRERSKFLVGCARLNLNGIQSIPPSKTFGTRQNLYAWNSANSWQFECRCVVGPDQR